MRLYVDEDLASKELMTRLVDAGHEVIGPLRGEPDDRCWRHAQESDAVIVTMNVVDFMTLADAADDHGGLLVVYRQNDPTSDMTAADVSAAIGRVDETYPEGVRNLVLALNQFRW